MTTIKQVLSQASVTLADATDSAQLDAEVLLGFVLGRSRSYLHAFPEVQLTKEQLARFDEFIAKRTQRIPLAYITGEKEFWSLRLHVTSDTLVPRPDTELLVETALSLVPQETNIQAVDLGTGSGAIALALASQRPSWHLHAVDVSVSALDVARDNAQRLGVDNVSFYVGNWFTALPMQQFDLVLSNPPYVSTSEWQTSIAELQYEPRSALVAGEAGMDDIHEILRHANAYLKPGGYLLIEHGYAQGQLVREEFATTGAKNIRTICDLAGLERVTIGQF